MESFAQCQSLHHLKHLHLAGVILHDLSLVPLGIFLENVANTLKTLELEHCRMTDSQVSAFIPALNKCSQLIEVNFCDNDISMPVLTNLLHHTGSNKFPCPFHNIKILQGTALPRHQDSSSPAMGTIHFYFSITQSRVLL